ncbi:hybrid sensor histidine kinase/response regulator [Duganella phyllosphaerae]|uniref:histidine kinase n=1 Tax=Duganella phyllosphaerae TaxID=762836 RepID=A0A1E7X816_9BURK|nr:PAS domain-containing sensor histidine kinase [Duganella phyllosphaerae]OFA09277.1 blue-light-activated protein [Duganella phyllosphaerae]
MNYPFLNGGGHIAQIIASYDWAGTALGAIDTWPQSLKTTVSTMLRSTLPMVALMGEDGIMIYNDGYSEFAGRRHPMSLGSKVGESWPEVAEHNAYVIRVALAGGTLAYKDQEMTLLRSGKPEQVWMDLDYAPVLDEAGKPCGVLVVVVDTTAKIRAEHQLRASENTFRTLAQAMPSQVWAADADGALNWFNEQVYRYSGTQPGQLAGDGWTAIVHAEDSAKVGAAWRASVATAQNFEVEYRIRRADGAWRWHIVRAMPIIDDNGVVQRWVGTSTDIEDQKATASKLQQQVAERTAERDRMWRYATDVMLVTTLDGWITAANPAFTRLLGWEEAEIIGTSIHAIIHPDDAQSSHDEMASLAQGRSTFKFENRTLRKGGGHAILSWTAVPDEGFIHAVGRDMTAERAAAEEMRRTSLKLQQAQKMEAIGKLTGGVAHDFNNLLQVISGNLQLLAADVAGMPRAERRLEQALAGVTRGAKLASYLLAFGRRQALDPRVVRIGRFIAGMEDMLRRSLGEEIEVETVISGGLWNTLVDTAQVENAVLNLCINARDAMDGVGKLTIEVGNAMLDDHYARNHPELTPGQYVMIAVSDTGTGMAPEIVAQAFDPFFSTKPEGKGSGLGLSMVYGFVRQSGGHVQIYSEPGCGTTVKLYLPRSTDIEDAPAPPEMRAVVGGQETILVAEDDEGVRATVVDMLGELGYRVLKASDAASALSIIDSGMPIDLLFTDVVMPGPLRSPELARKARERLPGIAVLFTSGYTENAIVHGGRLDAGVDLLGKPYTREALARKVRHVLANRQHAVQLAAQPAAAMAATTTANATDQPSGQRILLVEDEPELRETTAELLELLGHQVSACGDAASALAALAEGGFDVMLTDISLPDLSGEVLATRALALQPGLRVIFASGQTPKAALAGAQLLLKPFSIDQLVDALARS